jgi:hypothetical protein
MAAGCGYRPGRARLFKTQRAETFRIKLWQAREVDGQSLREFGQANVKIT